MIPSYSSARSLVDPGRDANFGALGGWTGRGETSSAQIDLVLRARGRTVATLRDFDAAFIISIHRPNPGIIERKKLTSYLSHRFFFSDISHSRFHLSNQLPMRQHVSSR